MMKKKLLTLCMGVGMTLGAASASASTFMCQLGFEGCMNAGLGYSYCISEYNACMAEINF